MKRTGIKSRYSIVIVGFVIAIFMMFSKGMLLQLKAEEELLITNLEVAVIGNKGVVARCSYQNYTDQTGCEVRLYLYRIENGREIVESQISLSFATQGCDSTQLKYVPDGVYRASVTMDDGIQIRQINSLNCYQVSRRGENYIITEIAGDQAKGQLEQENEVSENLNYCSHHECDYFLIEPATPEKDAVQAYQCTDCGAVLEYKDVPNSAYTAFLKEAEKLIQSASPQSEIIISTDRWVSFNRDVLEAMKVRQDITVQVNYRYQGENCSLVMPAGVDVELLMDENGFAGFRYIEEILTGGD